MKNNYKIILENKKNEFNFKKGNSKFHVSFNRVAFIFFCFFLISLIYSIHLLHLGSRQEKISINNFVSISNNLYRADIVDRNDNYLVKKYCDIHYHLQNHLVIQKSELTLEELIPMV